MEVYELDPVWGLRAAVGQALDSKIRSQIPSFVLSAAAAEALFCFLVDGGVVDKTWQCGVQMLCKDEPGSQVMTLSAVTVVLALSFSSFSAQQEVTLENCTI